MKKTSKFVLVLAVFFAGQVITADDISPKVLAEVQRMAEEINKLPPGSDGVFGPIETPYGEVFAENLRGICEETIRKVYPHITFYNRPKVDRAMGLKPDTFYTADKIRDSLAALGGPEWMIIGRADDDGFHINIGSFDFEGGSGGGAPGIPFKPDEVWKIITNMEVPPTPNYTLIQLNGEIFKTAYNRDGNILAVTTVGGGIFSYNSFTKKLVKTIKENGPKAIPIYTPDNQLLLAEDTGFLRIIGNKEAEIKIGEKPLSAIDVSAARTRCYVGLENEIKVVDWGTKTILFSFEHVLGEVKKIVLTHDGKTVVALDRSGIGIWDAATGKKIKTIPDTAGVNTFAVDKTGNIALARKNRIYIFYEKTQTRSDAFKAPGQPGGDADITSLDFSPNGTYLLSGNSAGLVYTWHAGFLLGMHSIEAHLAAVSASQYRQDGNQYVTGGGDAQLLFFDGAPPEPSGTLKVVNNTDTNAVITINAKTPKEGASIGPKATKTYQNILSGSTEVAITNPAAGLIIDASGRPNANIPMTTNGYTITISKESVPSMDFDLAGRLIQSSLSMAGNNLVTIATKAGSPTKSDSGRAACVTLNIETGVMTNMGLPNEQHRKNINDSAWCGNLYITASDEGVFLWQNQKFEAVLDRERCDNISASNDGKFLTTSSADYGTKLYDLPARKLIRQIQGGEKALLHNGSILYVINGKEVVRETIEGTKIPVFPMEKSDETSIGFPTGIDRIRAGYKDAVLISRKDGYIEVRNTGPGTPLTLPGGICVQNTKGMLAVSHGEIRTYDIETGSLLKTIFAHNAVITDLAFLSDNLLMSASRDGSGKIFNVNTAAELGRIGIFEDKEKVFIKGDMNYGDPLHILRNGKRL